jgi:hypothetical protein
VVPVKSLFFLPFDLVSFALNLKRFWIRIHVFARMKEENGCIAMYCRHAAIIHNFCLHA